MTTVVAYFALLLSAIAVSGVAYIVNAWRRAHHVIAAALAELAESIPSPK